MWQVILAISLGLLLVYVLTRKSEGLAPTFPSGYMSAPGVKYPADFGIYNYLQKPIRIDITSEGQRKTLIKSLPANTREGVDKEDVIRYFTPGATIDVFLLSGSGADHYSSIVVDTKMLERIKNLHIGMITTRFIGKTTDTLRMLTTANNANQGIAFLKIHNVTDLPLRLSLGIETLTSEGPLEIAPHSTIKYLGYRHQGVTLGTYFKDPDGLYPVYQYLIPNSDLYYGLSSDLKQPLQGCFQLEFNDECDPNQTLWPFEMGQM